VQRAASAESGALCACLADTLWNAESSLKRVPTPPSIVTAPIFDSPPAAPRSLPLERKLPLLIFGVLSLILVLSVGVSYYEVRRAAQVSTGERLSSLSHVLASMSADPVTSRLALMRHVSADTAVAKALRTPDRPPSPEASRALATLIGRTDSLTPPELWTTDGRPIGAVRLETPSDLQRFQEDVRAHTRISDTAYVGKLFIAGGHASLWAAVPVRQGGEIVGYIAQIRRIGTNGRVVQAMRDLIGSEIQLFIRNADGDAWFRVSGESVSGPTNVRPFGNGLQLMTHGDAGLMLASTTAVAGTPFAVTIEQPMSTILDRPRATIRTLGAIAILLAVLGAVIAWVIGRQLARPLVELTAAAEALARGDYSERVTSHGTDEIGRLGVAFNRMAEQVQESSEASTDAVRQLTTSVATQFFLAEASRILAGSLSDELLLAELARYCVPKIGDYCSVHLVDDDGSLRRVETVHYDPTKQETVRELVSRYRYHLDGPGEVPQSIRAQSAVVIPHLDRTSILNTAGDPTTMRLFDAVGPTSFMCVPLVARGRAFGAISFTMTDSGRVFSNDDADLAMELARRTAVAIDNALIYRRSLSLRLEAEAASSAKSDFLAKMSHEIRTPINAMMGYAELLEMGISGPVSASQAKQLSRIRASGEHLTSLVNEILDLAKIEAGRMSVEPTNARAGEAIEVALGLVRPQAASKGVELASAIDGSTSLEYTGDPQRVQQILTNLLSNAVKFTAPGGRVVLRCSSAPRHADSHTSDEWACITVEDTGVGIAHEDLERIFDPFVQVEGGYTRMQGGTGLGLTISRALAQLMGGEISVESIVGEGSRFTLWLPSPSSSPVPA
jgi:signal transduction histidine kinase